MTAVAREDEGRAGSRGRPAPAAAVLADRLAAALVHHEPGWRLPRLTALARRYSVSSSEIDAAIEELAARHLVRRLPDGQVYRASPAEYWVPLEGVFGLVSRVDPMGGQLVCTSRHTTVEYRLVQFCSTPRGGVCSPQRPRPRDRTSQWRRPVF